MFEDNVTRLEDLAARPGTSLDDMLARITEQTIDSAGFVEVIASGTDDQRLSAVTDRVRAAMSGPLNQAHPTGTANPALTADDVRPRLRRGDQDAAG